MKIEDISIKAYLAASTVPTTAAAAIDHYERLVEEIIANEDREALEAQSERLEELNEYIRGWIDDLAEQEDAETAE